VQTIRFREWIRLTTKTTRSTSNHSDRRTCSSQQVEPNVEQLEDREQHARQPEAAASGQVLDSTTSRETATSTLFVSY